MTLPAAWQPKILSLSDFEAAARKRLPRPIFGYVSGTSETSASYNDNRAAYQEWGLVPRSLCGVEFRRMDTTLFGRDFAAPFGICPMGMSALAAYRGDLALAGAAKAANIPMLVSGSALIALEEVIKMYPNAWFQAYLPGDPAKIDALVARVAAAGYETLVVTVDAVVGSNRENIVRTGFSTPLKPSLRLAYDGLSRPGWLIGTMLRTLLRHGMPHFENSYAMRGAPIISSTVMRDFSARDHLSWKHVEQIRRQWQGRLVIKGVNAPQDAAIAWNTGADGVILSNHGGRQLDYAISPLRILPAVAAELKGKIAIMLDGGVRRGTDVLKAIALGADFVFVGRPFLYAAVIGGQAGVTHGITLLKDEVLRDLGLLGINSLAEISPSYLHPLNWRAQAPFPQDV